MTCRVTAVVVLAVLVLGAHAEAAAVKKVVGLDGAGENLLKSDAWRPYDKGFVRDGDAFVCDNGADAGAARGAAQTVVLNQPEPRPVIASAWGRAEGVVGPRGSDYAIYLDITYSDGEPLWGQAAAFSVGTHDWERREVRVYPAKPIKSLSFYLLFRRHPGKAAFRGAELRELRDAAGFAWFDGVAVAPAAPPAERFIVRDAAAATDFVDFQDGRALGLKLDFEKKVEGACVFYSGRLADLAGKDRAVTLAWTRPLAGAGWRWLLPRGGAEARAPAEYVEAARVADVGQGRLSRYPLAAVARGGEGEAVAIDMGRPAFFRVGFASAQNELYIAYDLGLAPEKPSAEFCFCACRFDAAWGFRAAVAELYRIFPDYFRSRTPEQGVWMPFHNISKVAGWEDFGFKFKEGNSETAWDDAHGIITFRYTEPMTWWMSMPKELPRTYDAALAEARRLADKGNASAKALLASGHHDAEGRFVARMRDEPWCNGAVWSMNSSPGIAGEVTDFKNKWSAALREKLYGPARKGDLDGEYVDSAEAYVTDDLDYRRDHFAAARTPLVWAAGTHRPAIFKGLIAYEYVRGMADDVHGMGKLMMANSTPHNWCWLAPWLDVLGTETNWNPDGRWRPMADAEMMYRRVLCGPKPYCFLMNTDFDKWPYELTEKYMRRCLAYGMFPGFFSANASTGHYFSRPDLYNRDRPLFKKYVPLAKRVAEAGWQPVTRARSDNPKVYVERWGEKLLTVFNDSAEKQAAAIALDGPAPAAARELVRGGNLAWPGGKATLTLDAEGVALIELP
ncbi:MAG: hypothetical protein FJ288_10245 [Planctomycetes bacterium]|nr:hypothetical protein [Planctomycetota bacterium]